MHKLYNIKYEDSLIKRYSRLAQLPGFVLLESADKSKGRYDILSAYPYERLQINTPQEAPAAFVKLQALISPTEFSQESVSDLPFQGGAIGYFSYDLGAALNNLAYQPQTSLQGVPLLNFGLYDWALIVDHKLQKITLFAALTQSDTAAIVAEILALWHSETAPTAQTFNLAKKFSSLVSQDDYNLAFTTIHQHLKAGRCYQVNYTQPFKANYEGDAWLAYRLVGAHNPMPFAAFLRNDGLDILSFSPERFLLHENNVLLTSPIKGTVKRGHDDKSDAQLRQFLLKSTKNLAENIMIVDLLRNDLGKVAQIGSVTVPALAQIQSFQGVHHLVSDVTASLKLKAPPMDAFKACFPGGSITGAPKLEAMRVIAENEIYARGIYCGNIAYFSRHGRFDSNIAIRTIIAHNNILHLAVGGGIVIDSSCDDEYAECLIKIAAITKALYTKTDV